MLMPRKETAKTRQLPRQKEEIKRESLTGINNGDGVDQFTVVTFDW